MTILKKISSLLFMAIVIFTFNSCDKEESEKYKRAFKLFCNELQTANFQDLDFSDFLLNDRGVYVQKSESEFSDLYFYSKKDVTYSYKVTEKVGSTKKVSNFSGTLKIDAFLKDQINMISIVRAGSGWELQVNGKFADVNGTSNISNSYNCVSGNCQTVSSGGQYSSLSACQSACGNSGTNKFSCVSGNCVEVSSGGQYATLSDCQNTCGGSGSSILVNKTINGGAKDRQYYSFVVPANVIEMVVQTNEIDDATYNHADLFVRKFTKPTCNDDPHTGYQADRASLSNNREEDKCTIPNPPAGTWHVMLYNYNGSYYSSKLKVTITK